MGHPLDNAGYSKNDRMFVSAYESMPLENSIRYCGSISRATKKPHEIGVEIDSTLKTARLQWYKEGLRWGDYSLVNKAGMIEKGTHKQLSKDKTIAVSILKV